MKKTEPSFWDTSAIVPLCVSQAASTALHRIMEDQQPQVVWWGTSVEVLSAFSRLSNVGSLSEEGLRRAMAKLAELRHSWIDIVPSDRVRSLAETMPARHSLRAGDSFQLAAALVWCDEKPRNHPFVCADRRLADAAREHGFAVIFEIG